MYLVKKLLIIAVLILMAIGVATAQQSSKSAGYPSFMRLSLAGATLGDNEGNGFTKYDPKQRYFLIAYSHTEGDLNLVLTPQPESFLFDPSDPDRWKGVKRVTLPRLRTGTGVNIGDTPQQVRRKLGTTPHREAYDRRKKERVWHYFGPITMKVWTLKRKYIGEYRFRNERLWSIEYTVSDLGPEDN
jgi:hypothetical protein